MRQKRLGGSFKTVNQPRKFRGDPAMGIADDVIRKKPPRKKQKIRKNPFPLPPDRA